MKLLKVSTAIHGCGKQNFPTAKLTEICPDYVYLDEDTVKWAGDRNKPMLVNSFIAYIRSMGPFVIAVGEEKQRKLMRHAECEGFYIKGTTPLTLEKAITEEAGID